MSKVRSDFYVYEWYNIDTNKVFYVGKGTKSRWKNVSGRNQYFLNYHNKYNCDVRKIRENMTEAKAFELEIKTISYYKNKGQCQCNLSEGGEGCTFDEDSWDYMYRKVRNLYNFPNIRLDEMPYSDFFYYKDLKKMEKYELEFMYYAYLQFREKMLIDDIIFEEDEEDDHDFENYLKYAGVIELDERDYAVPYNKMSLNQLLDTCDFIHIQTLSLISNIIDNNVTYREKTDIKNLYYFLNNDERRDDFISKLFSNFEYCCYFTHAIFGAMWLIKNNETNFEEYRYSDIDIDENLIIKTFSLIDSKTLRVRLKLNKKSKVKTLHINIYKVIWDMCKDTTALIYKILYENIEELINNEDFN